MAYDDSTRGRAGRIVRLVLQAFHDDADQRPDAEVGRPRVGAREIKLGQLVLHPRQKPGVVAAAALPILAAVGVPTVGCQRAAPAVGLLVARFEERFDRLVSSSLPSRSMQIDKGRQRPRRARRAKREHLDPIGVRDGHSAVAGAEIDAIPERKRRGDHGRSNDIPSHGATPRLSVLSPFAGRRYPLFGTVDGTTGYAFSVFLPNSARSSSFAASS